MAGAIARAPRVLSRSFAFTKSLSIIFAVCAVAMFGTAQHASANLNGAYTASKKLCLAPVANPSSCPAVTIAGVGQPVVYVFTITNPIGSPQQQITMTEAGNGSSGPGWPAGFVPSGPTTCTNMAGGVVSGTGPAGGSFLLQIGETVNCMVPGSFNASSSQVGGAAANMAHIAGDKTPAGNTNPSPT